MKPDLERRLEAASRHFDVDWEPGHVAELEERFHGRLRRRKRRRVAAASVAGFALVALVALQLTKRQEVAPVATAPRATAPAGPRVEALARPGGPKQLALEDGSLVT